MITGEKMMSSYDEYFDNQISEFSLPDYNIDSN